MANDGRSQRVMCRQTLRSCCRSVPTGRSASSDPAARTSSRRSCSYTPPYQLPELLTGQARVFPRLVVDQGLQRANGVSGPVGQSRTGRRVRLNPAAGSGNFAANSAWLVLAAIAFNLTRAAGALASGFHAKATTATIRAQLISVPGRIARSARTAVLHLPTAWPWESAWHQLFNTGTGPPLAA